MSSGAIMAEILINTCSEDVIIAIYNNGKFDRTESVIGQKNNSQFIMPTIKKALDGKNPDKIYVVNGPGSFTGVRLGVTIAKTFAYTLEIPIKTISSLELKAVSLVEKNKIVGVKENNGYYIGIFDEDNKQVGDYEYIDNDAFEEFNNKHHVFTKVIIDYNKVYNYLKTKEELNPHAVKPLYIKKISVEK